jgi:hypothetical protein
MDDKHQDATRPEPLEYEQCDVPEGMTLDEYRRRRAGDKPPERVWLRGWRRHKKREEST